MGVGWTTPCPGRFTTSKNPVPIVQEAVWASDPVWKISPPPGFFFVQGFYSIQFMSYICLADGQLGLQRLHSQYCYFTYFIVLARYYAPFRLCNNTCRFLHTLLKNYSCLYQCSADLQVKRVSSINMYTFMCVCH